MRTISVKEAAQALGVSTRAVQYKLQNGDLRGTRTKNQFGVQEWRVWPTKDIIERLTGSTGAPVNEMNFEPAAGDIIEAEIDYATISEPVEALSGEQASSASESKSEGEKMPSSTEEMFEWIAERVTRPLVEKVAYQERIIEELRGELKLLPDLQKKAQAEREAAEMLFSQIQELEEEKAKVEATAQEVTIALKTAEEEKQKAEESAKQAAEALQAVEALKSQIEELRQPFWKRLFRSGSGS